MDENSVYIGSDGHVYVVNPESIDEITFSVDNDGYMEVSVIWQQ